MAIGDLQNVDQKLEYSGVSGKYLLDITVGKVKLNTLPSDLMEFYIIEGTDLFLPVLKIKYFDRTGILTPVLFSKDRQDITIRLGLDFDDSKNYTWKFTLYKYKTENMGSFAQRMHYVMLYAYLNVDNVFDVKSRSFGSVAASEVALSVAKEMGVVYPMGQTEEPDPTAFVETVPPTIPLIQPLWSNMLLLMDLADHARSGPKEGGFYTFMSLDKFLYFKSVSGFMKQKSRRSYVYVSAEKPLGEKMAVNEPPLEIKLLDYRIVANEVFLQEIGGRGETGYYFDYFSSGDPFVTEPILPSEIIKDSLVPQYDMLQSVVKESRYQHLGSLDSPADIEYHLNKVKRDVSMLTEEFMKLEILVLGDNTMRAGDIVTLHLFGDSVQEDPFYSGDWFVSRVIHYVRELYYTKMVLTRPGMLIPSRIANQFPYAKVKST